MSGFDPAAATAAYLSTLPVYVKAAAERRAEAQALAWTLNLIGPPVFAFGLMRLGVIDRTWDWGRRRGAVAAGVVVVGLVALVSCAWEAVVGVVTGLGAPGPAGFCAGLVMRMGLFGLLLGLMKLAGRKPRLVLGGLAAAASFMLAYGPSVMSDLATRPLQAAPARLAELARAVARDGGQATAQVVISPSAPGEGDVVGLFRPALVVLQPDAANWSAAEVRAGVGHVLGHYRARDGFGWALLLAALATGGVVAVVSVARLARRDGSLADPRGLPLLWALGALWISAAVPVAFAWDRAVNLRADLYSLEHAREPDGLAMTLIRENGGQAIDPPGVVRWIALSHPPLRDRIDQAMRWKKAHIR